MKEAVRVIEVVPHDARWNKQFLEENEVICSIIGNEIISIHHIGSTAIPGIYAKPVIDIIAEVRNIGSIDSYNERMIKIGYTPKGENGITGRRYFAKGQYNRTHHLHVFQSGSKEVARHLNFRDYMIAHPEEAKCYEILKRTLAEKYRYNGSAYCDGKDSFIKEIDKRAEEWKLALGK